MRGDNPAARAMSVLAQTLREEGMPPAFVQMALRAVFLREHEAVLAGLLHGEREARPLAEIPTDKADMLRPMAETLAMIDGNAFFGHRYADADGVEREWWEQYVPEAEAIFDANNAGEGGGWAGLASFARRD